MFIQPQNHFETSLQIIFTVLTNICMIPGSIMCWKLGLPIDCIISSFAIVTSILYHTLELSEYEVLGGTSSHWHIADNVFASAAFCISGLNFIQYTSPYIALDSAKTITICINVICQLISPWDFRYTFWPIAISIAFTLIYLTLKQRRPRIDTKWGAVAILSSVFSLLCFYKGLDDEKDFLRFYHGLWHLGVSAFMYAVLKCSNPVDLVEVRLEAHRKAHSHFLDELPLQTSTTILSDIELGNKLRRQ